MVAERIPRFTPASGPSDAGTSLSVRNHELLAPLTAAERLVAVHAAQGFSNKEISAALGRAEATIKHQLAATMRKLGVQSRCQLIVLLLR